MSICSECGRKTEFACSDCKMDFGETIYLCKDSLCRDKHEIKYGCWVYHLSPDNPIRKKVLSERMEKS